MTLDWKESRKRLVASVSTIESVLVLFAKTMEV